MPRIGFLDGVDGQGADGVDAKRVGGVKSHQKLQFYEDFRLRLARFWGPVDAGEAAA